jgi:putative membrane protein
MKPIHAAALCAALAAAPAVAQDAASPPAVAPADLTASQFVQTAVVSNAFELETSRAVLAATSDAEVRAFAETMIRDHEQAAQDLVAAAAAAGVEPPAPYLDRRHADMLATLSGADPSTVDDAYVEMQVEAHAEAIALFSAYAERPDPLGTFAAETLPRLEAHAAAAGALAAE